MTEGAPKDESADVRSVARTTRLYERGASWARGIALAWASFTALTFLLLGVFPQSAFSGDATPIFIGGAVVAVGFVIGLAWPPWADVEGSLGRVELLLRWQVAIGVILAFTIAFAARQELMMPFAIYGFYLVVTALPGAAHSLLSTKLRELYSARDHVTAEAQRRKEFEELSRLIAASRRPLIAWPLVRRKDGGRRII